MTFWSSAELGVWICEALRVYNSLTGYWAEPFVMNVTPPFAGNWFLANGTDSPRQQTLTDNYLYALMEYHLLEPTTGGVWSGSNQFSIADLSQALSRRRNEVLQASACNMGETAPAITPGTSVATLADTVLDVRRVRWLPVTGDPVTLQRGDVLSFQRFTPDYAQATAPPLRWDVLGSPPQDITLDTLTPVPGVIQVLGINGAIDFVPPSAHSLLVPDDWAWVLKFGALADVLTKEQEGRDLERADYCRKRYVEGMKAMERMPWLIQASVNGVPVDTQPVAGADRFNYEWQSRATAFPELVVGGIDLFAVSPVPTEEVSIGMRVIANAPCPAADADEIQVPRDVMDAILDEAQHLALFKMGGQEFKESLALHQSFIHMAADKNSRMKESGIFATDLRPPVSKQDEDQPRYAVAKGR